MSLKHSLVEPCHVWHALRGHHNLLLIALHLVLGGAHLEPVPAHLLLELLEAGPFLLDLLLHELQGHIKRVHVLPLLLREVLEALHDRRMVVRLVNRWPKWLLRLGGVCGTICDCSRSICCFELLIVICGAVQVVNLVSRGVS